MKTIFIIIIVSLILTAFVTWLIYLAFKNAVEYPDDFDDNPIYTKYQYENEVKE